MRIAIIGASPDRKKFSNKAVRAYLKKGWDVVPVNPKYDKIENLECYPTIISIPGDVEIVSFYVHPDVGEEIAKLLPKKNVKTAYLNPGSESENLIQMLKNRDIKPILACSIHAAGFEPGGL